jgi:hypothetical protein
LWRPFREGRHRTASARTLGGQYCNRDNTFRFWIDIIWIGTRFNKRYKGLLIPRIGNQLLSTVFNIFFRRKFHDVFTCYKLFRSDILKKIAVTAKDFNIEMEKHGYQHVESMAFQEGDIL